MPNTHSTLRGLFSDIADAIREKDGSSGTIVADTFPDAIRAIPTGGGGEAAKSKDVNFFDFDGTILYSYTKSEFAVLTEMPDNPSHDGLTSQGWNWTLANAKSYVNTYGKLNIGQMYLTSDGKTRIYIHLEDGRLSPMLGVCPNGSVTVDWGDASATTALTGTSVSKVKWTSNHTYAAPGDYVITLSVSGSMGIMGGAGGKTGSCLLRYSSTGDNRNYGYRSAIRRVEIGNGVTNIGAYAFGSCYSLASVTIPSSVTSIGTYAFDHCYSLASVTIPSSVTSIGAYAFGSCYSLASVTIPSSVTSIGTYAFYSCYSLGYIKFTAATPPTVSNSNAWTSIPSDCKIYVPSGSLSAYTSATNYPSSSTYTYIGY